jgi:hypothetical protein
MNRSGWLFLALILLVAAYVGSYVYLVSTHKSNSIPFSGPSGPIVTQRFCYSQNPRIDSICNPVFLPIHYVASTLGLQRAAYVSAEEQQREAAVFCFFVSRGR